MTDTRPTTDLTAEEAAQFAAMLEQLRAEGYVEIAEHNGLKLGTRIRHTGHQWPEAFTEGTGVVVALTEKSPSGWSDRWGAPDIELIALWDKPSFGSRLSQLAQYHVIVVEQL